MTDIFGQKSQKTQTRNYRLINETFNLFINSDTKNHALSNKHVVICHKHVVIYHKHVVICHKHVVMLSYSDINYICNGHRPILMRMLAARMILPNVTSLNIVYSLIICII